MTADRLSGGAPGAGARAVDPPTSVTAFLAESSAAHVVVDDRCLVAYANDAAAQLFQRPAEAMVGQPVSSLVHEEDRGPLGGWVQQSLAVPGPRAGSGGAELAVRALRPDGSQPTVALSLFLLDRGHRGRWTVIGFTDVSARVAAEASVARLSRAYLMLAQLNQAVIDSRDAQALFASTTRVCVDQGGFLGSSVAVPLPGGGVKMVATAGDVAHFVSSLVITLDPDDPHGQGPTGRALRDGLPCFVPDFLTSEITAPWREVAVVHGVGAVVALPLRTDGRVVASLSIYADRAIAFDEGVAELFLQVADNVSHALDGYAAEQALVAEVRTRHALLRRLVTAEENERARIAAGIHDDSVQTMAAVELRLGMLLRKLGSAPELADHVAMLRTLVETVGSASSSLRNLLFELEPPLLAQPFGDALDTVAGHVFEDESTTWVVRGAEGLALPEETRTQALRIVKEALINARKHARAGHVVIEVRPTGQGVEVSVTDDGVGLPPAWAGGDRLARRGHRGLETMRDRATASDGWLRLEPAPTGGACITFFVPVAPAR